VQAYEHCEEVLMEWIVRTRDQRDNRGCERRYDTEPDFVSGVNELLGNRWQRIVSATLPGGVILDEEKLCQLMRRSFPKPTAATSDAVETETLPRSTA
jgi:hypothetical protein